MLWVDMTKHDVKPDIKRFIDLLDLRVASSCFTKNVIQMVSLLHSKKYLKSIMKNNIPRYIVIENERGNRTGKI